MYICCLCASKFAPEGQFRLLNGLPTSGDTCLDVEEIKVLLEIDQRKVDVSRTSSYVSCNEMCVLVCRSVGRSVDVFFIWSSLVNTLPITKQNKYTVVT